MATLAKVPAAVNRRFLDQLPTIESVIATRCHSPERRQNALCWAWQLFARYLPTAESTSQAAIAAAVYASRERRTFGRPPRQGQWDTLDSAMPLPNDDAVAPEDDAPAELPWAIEQMPPSLQMVARPLAEGLNKTQTAELLGVSTKTVQRRVAEIATWIVEHSEGDLACQQR